MSGAIFGLVAVALGVAGWFYVQWLTKHREEQRVQAARMAAELREQVLSRKFGAARPETTGPTGAVMDMPVDVGLATLVALDDDTVSLYLNPGGGMIGAGTHDAVARRAAGFRSELARLQSRLSPATVFPAPAPGYVVFYLLTKTTTLSSGPLMETQVGRDGHPFAAVHRAAHEVIAAIRQLDG